MSNYPLSYKLSWLPRFLKPSLDGSGRDFAPPSAQLMSPMPARTIRLAFIGDISAVASRQAPACDPTLKALLGSADLVIGNCESPVVGRVRARFGTWVGTHHAMEEAFLADAMAAVGIRHERSVLSVANNHMLDQGVEGFAETIDALRHLGVQIIGAADRGPVQRVDAGGLTIGFAAFTVWRNASEALFSGRVSAETDPKLWPAGSLEGADLLCAVPHWGWEFRHFPQRETMVLARRLVEHGFGLIAGHHAHVLQPVGLIGQVPVAYGLGDFLGTALARQPWPGRIGAILTVDVSAEPESLGKVAAYKMHPFMRLRDGRRERLMPVTNLSGALRARVEERLARVLGTAQP
ncbi:CapA family protein [Mesorhizobium sp. 1M-11]|uniref:CapA family protein n=1 Tax=Mesorhizobium sp. 1M-11 TaxID=1529006 RepID=UPI0006C77527|nr:CapA family protein [Mesorhizobium sp. 1M-11]